MGEKRGSDGGGVTTSHLPGTTLGLVRVSVLGRSHALYDTPGIVLPNQLTTNLTTDELAQVTMEDNGSCCKKYQCSNIFIIF